MSNHPDTCLLDGHDGWIVCGCHANRWRRGEIVPCGCFYGNCDMDQALFDALAAPPSVTGTE